VEAESCKRDAWLTAVRWDAWPTAVWSVRLATSGSRVLSW
jgi:hypothetical protein